MNNKKIRCALICLSMTALIACGSTPVLTASISTSCIHDASVQMDGVVEFTSNDQFKKDKDHEAKEGYEWRVARATVTFDDPEVLSYMPMPDFCLYDTKNQELYSSTLTRTGETMDIFDGEAVYSYTFTLDSSTDCKGFCHSDVKSEDIDKDGKSELIYMLGWDALVPEGYDGLVAVVYPHQTVWPEGALLSEVETDEFIYLNLN